MKKPRIIDLKNHSKIKQSQKAEVEKLGAWLAEFTPWSFAYSYD
jgi:hypothetical protein